MSGSEAAQRPKECRRCAYFCNDPAYLEHEFAGLASFSSGHASVRADDGICGRHRRYLGATSLCSDFLSRERCVEGTH